MWHFLLAFFSFSVQERAGNTLEAIGIGNGFLNRTQMAQKLREKIDKWDCIKLKRICTTKEMVTRLKKQPTKWEKIFASYASDKGLINRIFRELKKQTPQKPMTQLRNGQMNQAEIFQRKKSKWPKNT
jgi:hypothetical protein